MGKNISVLDKNKNKEFVMKKGVFVLVLLMLFIFSVFSNRQEESPQKTQKAPKIQAALDLSFIKNIFS